MTDWWWVTTSTIAGVGIISSAIAFVALRRLRFQDRILILTKQVQHLLVAGVPCDLRRIRKTKAPTTPWYPLEVAWCIARRRPLFRATNVAYEPSSGEVLNATFEWGVCATATDMYNRVYESSEALPARCDREFRNALAWHSAERGCIIWIERVFPKPGKKLPKWFRNESESLKKPPSSALGTTAEPPDHPTRRVPPPGLRSGTLSTWRHRQTVLGVRACDHQRSRPSDSTGQRRQPSARTAPTPRQTAPTNDEPQRSDAKRTMQSGPRQKPPRRVKGGNTPGDRPNLDTRGR